MSPRRRLRPFGRSRTGTPQRCDASRRPTAVPTLKLSARLAYAVPGLVFALVGIPIYVHLPKFYGDALGVDLRVIGLAILASRIWDAVTDPAVGYLSDHTRSRWGRRRPWIAAGALPLAAAVALLLTPPAADARGTGLWMTVLLFVAFLAWTSIQIPHAALGAELAPDYHARTSLYAWRDALFILGTLAAASAPAVIRAAGGFSLTPDGERRTFRVLAALYAPLLLLLPLWCAVVLREPAIGGRTSSVPPWRATRDALRNEPFRVVLGAYAIGALGSALPGTLSRCVWRSGSSTRPCRASATSRRWSWPYGSRSMRRGMPRSGPP